MFAGHETPERPTWHTLSMPRRVLVGERIAGAGFGGLKATGNPGGRAARGASGLSPAFRPGSVPCIVPLPPGLPPAFRPGSLAHHDARPPGLSPAFRPGSLAPPGTHAGSRAVHMIVPRHT